MQRRMKKRSRYVARVFVMRHAEKRWDGEAGLVGGRGSSGRRRGGENKPKEGGHAQINGRYG